MLKRRAWQGGQAGEDGLNVVCPRLRFRLRLFQTCYIFAWDYGRWLDSGKHAQRDDDGDSMSKVLATTLMLLSSGALACSETHDYVETSRIEMTAKVASVFMLTGQHSHLVNVSARLSNGHAILLTIPGEAVAPGKRLMVEEVIFEDRLQNGEPAVQYDFVEIHTD